MTALPAWIDKEAWQGFCDMRKAIKKPMTPRAETLLLKTLYELKDKGHDPNAALDQSTLCNWQDVYPPKAKDIPNMKRETYQPEAPMTPEEKAASDAAKARVMQAISPLLKRVA